MASLSLQQALAGGDAPITTQPVGGVQPVTAAAPVPNNPGRGPPGGPPITVGAPAPVTPVPGTVQEATPGQQSTVPFPPAVTAAANAIFAQDPSQAAVFQNQYGGDMTAWLNSFTQWWSNFGSQVAGQMQNFQPEVGLLNALGYSPAAGGNWQAGPNAVVQAPPLGSTAPGSGPVPAAGTPGSGSTNQPADEGLYNMSIGSLTNQVQNDANLAQTTQQLTDQTQQNYGQLGGVLSQAIAAPGQLSQVTQQQNQGIATAANAQLTSLANSVQAMQGALTGSLAQQQAALQQSIQQQQQNIATYGDTASQALTQQIAQQVSDLQTSIASQQQALQTQIQQLSGAADASSQAQLAALQTQLSQLNTAEAPVAQARTAAAQMQVTGVNIAEQQAKNQITAQQQLQGFVGGSTELDNALVQAGITAQQQGATDVGNAALENTQDYQGIANQGANTQAAIGNTLAQQQQAIADQSATGQGSLASALATGTQGLQDTGASGQAAITNTVAQQQEANQNTGAQTQYQNTSLGIAGQDSLANALASGQNTINSTAAQQVQANLNNQYNQSLQAALANASLPGQEAGQIAAIQPLQNVGLLDAQQALGYWGTGQTSTAPTPTTTTQVAPTTGNTIAQAGASLLNGAISLGNSTHWWQAPVTTPATTNTTSGGSTSTTQNNLF